jgi:hypothetical protein
VIVYDEKKIQTSKLRLCQLEAAHLSLARLAEHQPPEVEISLAECM